MGFRNPETVIWHRFQADGEDEYGNEVAGAFIDVEIRAAFAPQSIREAEGERVVTDAVLYLKEPIDYGTKDRFTIRGAAYGAEGASQGGWVSPFSGRMHGQAITVKRVTG